MTNVSFVSESRANLGESPVWIAEDHSLWWVDIAGRAVHCAAAGETRRWPTDEPVSALIPRAAGGFIAAMQSALFAFDPVAGTFRPMGAPEGHPPTHRFNDATTDHRGRLLIGTMCLDPPGAPTGALYAFDGQAWRLLADGYRTVNGLAVSPNGKELWVSDSHPEVRAIRVHAYDQDGATLGPVLRTIPLGRDMGRPDGAAFDREGGYWIAGVGGWAVHRFHPDGSLDRSIRLPVEKPSKPAFGSAGLATMYVTSVALGLTDPQTQPNAGSVMALNAGVAGLPLARCIA